MYFDSHAHYDSNKFANDRAEILKHLPHQGVTGVLNAGADIASSKKGIALAEAYAYIYASVGVHPHDVKSMTEKDIDTLRELSRHEKVLAIGETGLDWHYDFSPRDTQRYWFARQLELAKELEMPVIIHSREASAETMEMLKASGLREGVLHCYSGSLPMALEYVEMGFCIGIGGVVTFGKKVKEVAKGIPLHSLLIETDAPYLAPVPHRGKRNDSSLLRYVVEEIAALRGVSEEEIAAATAENARRLFGL